MTMDNNNNANANQNGLAAIAGKQSEFGQLWNQEQGQDFGAHERAILSSYRMLHMQESIQPAIEAKKKADVYAKDMAHTAVFIATTSASERAFGRESKRNTRPRTPRVQYAHAEILAEGTVWGVTDRPHPHLCCDDWYNGIRWG